MRTYLEFLITRLFGTGVDTLVLWICSTFLFTSYWGAYVLSPIISFEFAVMSNYLWSYCWIWRKRIGNKSMTDFWKRFFIFNLSCVVGFLIKMLFLLIFEKIFEWDVVYCNWAALIISGLFNYFLADCVVFNKHTFASKTSDTAITEEIRESA